MFTRNEFGIYGGIQRTPYEEEFKAATWDEPKIYGIGGAILESEIQDREYPIGHATARYVPPLYPIPKESAPALHASLWQRAEELTVTDHVSLAEGSRLPKSINNYRLVPVLHGDPDFLEYSLSSVGENLVTSEGVTFEYGGRRDGMPYMDGRIGLGLAFHDRLAALCSGGIAREGPVILQLQDVSNKVMPDTDDHKILRSFPYSNGLYGGIDWKLS